MHGIQLNNNLLNKIINELQKSSCIFSHQISQEKYLLDNAAIHEMPSRDEVSPGPIYNISKMADQQDNVSHSIGKSQRYNINHGI
jgi:hypothetical protein